MSRGARGCVERRVVSKNQQNRRESTLFISPIRTIQLTAESILITRIINISKIQNFVLSICRTKDLRSQTEIKPRSFFTRIRNFVLRACVFRPGKSNVWKMNKGKNRGESSLSFSLFRSPFCLGYWVFLLKVAIVLNQFSFSFALVCAKNKKK